MFLSKTLRTSLLLATSLLCGVAAIAQQFTNALLPSGADPGAVYRAKDGKYYGSTTGSFDGVNTLKVYQASTLAELFGPTAKTVKVTITPSDAGIWAPSFWVDNQGVLYMYYGARGTNAATRVAYVPNVTDDPMQASSWKDMGMSLNLPQYDWSLYSQTVPGGSQLWGFYASPGHLWAQKMDNPLTPTAGVGPVTIATATTNTGSTQYQHWEHLQNDPTCAGQTICGANEAPSAFETNEGGQTVTYITYSSNSASGPFYAMGLLKFVGAAGAPMNAMGNWQKQTTTNVPWFSPIVWDYSLDSTQSPNATVVTNTAGNYMVGTGTATIVKAADNSLWNLYSGYFNSTFANIREVRMQPVALDGNGAPLNPQPGPAPEGLLYAEPSGEMSAELFITGNVTWDDGRIFYSGCLGHKPTDTQYANAGGANNSCPNVQGSTRYPAWNASSDMSNVNSTGANSYFIVRFSGTTLTLTGPTGPNYGVASIFIDGTWSGDVDLSKIPNGSGPFYMTKFPQSGLYNVMVMVKGVAGSQSTNGATSVALSSVSVQ